MLRIVALGALCIGSFAQPLSINPKVKKIVDEISEDRITNTLKKLEAFGTRHSLSTRVVDARSWISAELKSYSPRLEVSFDTYKVKKIGRVTRDAELVNVVAILPGTVNKDREVLVSAHYDTVALRARPAGGTPPATTDGAGNDSNAAAGAARPAGAANLPPPDPEAPAPGVNDDGSGTAAVMELARVMSKYEFEKTIVFVLFVAEEQGLFGSALMAEKAHKEKRQIEAVLNNDIIGSVASGNGEIDNHTVRVFSEDPADSDSRQIARYIKEVGERYVPSMFVDTIYRADRFGRGGDHTPFNHEGYAAVRFSSAEEDYSHQHTATDTLANMSPSYTTQVARVNAAVAASLAFAPKAPIVKEVPQRTAAAELDGSPRPVTPQAMVTRGRSRYDALIRWKADAEEADLAGYVVLVRSTMEADWQKRFFVGKVHEFTLPGVSIDSWVFGVQAVDTDGNASLVSAYTLSQRQRQKIETIPESLP